MRILKAGDVERLKQIKKFECKTCGCVFEADNTEYKYQYSQRIDEGWYEVKCPTCGKRVTTSDE